ncbi:MAG: hypothetical protein NTZ17_06800 [Phycisphaerae bacterium]|nr:hypothetical protein [Phycisphaerae bacterium]
MNIERRIEKAEKAVGIEAEPVTLTVIIISVDWDADETLPHFPEPVAEWVTLQKAMDEAERTRLPCVFEPNPFAEYEARHGLEPGTLAKHELRGKVPFAELLRATTGRTDEQWTKSDESERLG